MNQLIRYFGQMRVDDITANTVRTYRSQRMGGREDGAFKIKKTRPVSVNTQRNETLVLLGVLNWAKTERKITAVPFTWSDVSLKPQKREVYFDHDEWGRFIVAAEQDPKDALAVPMFRLILLLALRPIELCQMKNDSHRIDFREHRITILQTKDAKYSRVEGGLPKSIGLVPETEAILKPRCAAGGELVFTGPYGTVVWQDWLQLVMRRVCERAGLEPGRHGHLITYSIRHTAVTWLRKAGVPLSTVHEYVGHKAPQYSMTDGYDHSEQAENLRPVAALLARIEHDAVEKAREEALVPRFGK